MVSLMMIYGVVLGPALALWAARAYRAGTTQLRSIRVHLVACICMCLHHGMRVAAVWLL
jgi:hypothetical protein